MRTAAYMMTKDIQDHARRAISDAYPSSSCVFTLTRIQHFPVTVFTVVGGEHHNDVDRYIGAILDISAKLINEQRLAIPNV